MFGIVNGRRLRIYSSNDSVVVTQTGQNFDLVVNAEAVVPVFDSPDGSIDVQVVGNTVELEVNVDAVTPSIESADGSINVGQVGNAFDLTASRQPVELWRGDFRTLTPGALSAGPVVLNGRTFTLAIPTVGETVAISATNGIVFTWPNTTVGTVYVDPVTAGNLAIALPDLIDDYDPSRTYIIEVIVTQFNPAAGNSQHCSLALWTPANTPLTGAALRSRGAAFFRYSVGTGGEFRGATLDSGTVPGTTASALFPSIADTLGIVVQPGPVAPTYALSQGGDFNNERNTIGRYQAGAVAAAGNFDVDNAREAQVRIGAGNTGAGNAGFTASYSMIRVLAA